MARVFKHAYTRDVPEDAEISTKEGAETKYVRYRNGHGRVVVGELTPDGRKVRMETRKWYIEYRDVNGKKQRVPGYIDKAVTNKLASDLETDVTNLHSGRVTKSVLEMKRPITEHVRDYEAHLRAAHVSAKHFQNTTQKLGATVRECGFRHLVDVSSTAVENYLLQLSKYGRGPRTCNLYLEALRTFCNWCVREQRMVSNPLTNVKKLNTSKDIRHQRRALTEEELARLVRAARERPLRDAKYTAHIGGKRATQRDLELLGQERALIYKTMVLLAGDPQRLGAGC